MRRWWSSVSVVAVLAALVAVPVAAAPSAQAADEPTPTLRAGVATVDATWHVGRLAGPVQRTRAPHEDVDGRRRPARPRP
jgi:hypothetical protein